MSQDLKKAIRQEYVKCVSSPVHFMRKYCYIQHPDRGRILFNLYPFQEKILKLFNKEDLIINKGRQLGITTLVAAFSLWFMLFFPDKNILCIATKQSTAKNLVTKVKFMYENLPSWLKVGFEEKNKLTLRLKNGSQIIATAATDDAGRSESVSLLIIDEAAFISNIEKIWPSAQSTLATGGKSIVLSTPFGKGNWFHGMWVDAEEGENQFLPIKLPWYVHPERDQTWRDNEVMRLKSEKLAAQENDCNFSTSGDGVFHPEHLLYYEKNMVKEPLYKRGVDQKLWIWEDPDYTKDYMVIADVARGDDKDFSTFHVIDVVDNKQVAEYKAKIGTTDFGNLLVGVATEYNNALLIIENANIGWAVIQVAIDRNYQNLYYSPKGDNKNSRPDKFYDKYLDTNNMVAGFTNSSKTRPMLIGKLQEYVSEKTLIIQSARTLNEMGVFIWKNGRPEAQQGFNDDLVIPLGIAMYIRDTALKFRQRGIEMTKAVINNMKVNRTPYQGAYKPNIVQNPYKMKTVYGTEDIKWLL